MSTMVETDAAIQAAMTREIRRADAEMRWMIKGLKGFVMSDQTDPPVPVPDPPFEPPFQGDGPDPFAPEPPPKPPTDLEASQAKLAALRSIIDGAIPRFQEVLDEANIADLKDRLQMTLADLSDALYRLDNGEDSLNINWYT